MKNTLLFVVAFCILPWVFAQKKRLGVGDTIPSFSLTDQDNKIFNSADYIGKKILVIYFYPKDESAVCTKEACTFRDDYLAFEKAGALVIGINGAGIASHKSFQQNHHLPFLLLSDPRNKVLQLFGVRGKWMLTGRQTFVIDLTGKIVYTFDSFMKGTEHAENALAFVQKMQQPVTK